tara:strand:+ start:189 stop:308 length:120 start_codon:yes stop_codon:yes gene_type:complete
MILTATSDVLAAKILYTVDDFQSKRMNDETPHPVASSRF